MLRAVLCVLMVAVLASCGLVQRGVNSLLLKPQKPSKALAANQETFIGLVEAVNPEHKFVLVRMEVRQPIPAGTKLETRPQKGLRALLTVTPERKLSFLSADITEGLPVRGDVVVITRQAAAAMSATVTPAAPSPSPNPGPAPLLPPPSEPPLPLREPQAEPGSLPPPVQ